MGLKLPPRKWGGVEQALVIEEVDENGRPIKWKVADNLNYLKYECILDKTYENVVSIEEKFDVLLSEFKDFIFVLITDREEGEKVVLNQGQLFIPSPIQGNVYLGYYQALTGTSTPSNGCFIRRVTPLCDRWYMSESMYTVNPVIGSAYRDGNESTLNISSYTSNYDNGNRLVLNLNMEVTSIRVILFGGK